MMGCPPVPASTQQILRYAAYLARSRGPSTTQQYLNIIRLLHLEHDLDNPLAGKWKIQSLLQGIKRTKGTLPLYKLPLTLHHLRQMEIKLDLSALADLCLWAAILTAFFGLLRVSNFTVSSLTDWGEKCARRRDLSLEALGFVLHITGSKTIQSHDRVHQVVLPMMTSLDLCPASVLLRFIRSAGLITDAFPVFSYLEHGHSRTLTTPVFRRRLSSLLEDVGLQKKDYSTHSLRRGGATWLASQGVPVDIIRALGDWKSDAVFKYLTPDATTLFQHVNNLH
jgi:hypothetical protein